MLILHMILHLYDVKMLHAQTCIWFGTVMSSSISPTTYAIMLFGSWHGKDGLSVGSHVSPALLDLKPSLEGFQGEETTKCYKHAA